VWYNAGPGGSVVRLSKTTGQVRDISPAAVPLEAKTGPEVQQTRVLRRKALELVSQTGICFQRKPQRAKMSRTCPVVFDNRTTAPAGPRVVHHIRVQRIGNRIPAFALADWIPVVLRDLSVVSRLAIPVPLFLLWPIHPVRKPVIRRNPVEFSRRLVVPGAPGFPTVQADRGALIHTEHDSL